MGNNAACNFDGGDCCDNNRPNWDFSCTACECLEPSCKSLGGIEHWVGDNFCDDQNNIPACQFDGGDCCSNSQANWDKDTYMTFTERKHHQPKMITFVLFYHILFY